ncbi:DMT family transporter [Roseinatronobacter alkalisoli]|uniref:DMT family transporter n=1 Tax=Roseinatronobacter alkalisoli TaxID=3028235 RepID=A0ABT5TC32_9RHOB|nr:DMT family transporter [Roseinatronobacter sp. HJB301]MDD7972654.1 DMT family transporter [Roseinatronobacter sp. HJB301]
MHHAPNHPAKAAFWMCGAIASFIAMAVSGREIQTVLDSFELMFWRSLVGFAIVCTVVVLTTRSLRAAAPVIRPTRPGLHLTRNIFHFAGQNLWFYGLMLIPLSQLVALEFTMPIWVALLAPLVLGEIFTRKRLLVALLGFAGVLVVAQPGVQPLNSGHVAALLAAIGFAMNLLLTKRIMRHDGVLCVLFWMTLLQTLFGLGLAQIGGFTWPPVTLAPWLAVIGVTGLSAHYCLTTALGLAPASTVAPMEFLRLPLIALVGVWLYAETLDPLVFAGAGIIILANWINIRPARRTI